MSQQELFARTVDDSWFHEGNLNLLKRGTRTAIIGTRKPSREGRIAARRVARAAVERGEIVVSGLAIGIDEEAHRGAIGAGGRTIAVLGVPLDCIQARSTASLQQLIGREHLLLSQFPAGSGYVAGNYPKRNRAMISICSSVIVADALEDSSGTMGAAYYAHRSMVPVFIAARKGRARWMDTMIDDGRARRL